MRMSTQYIHAHNHTRWDFRFFLLSSFSTLFQYYFYLFTSILFAVLRNSTIFTRTRKKYERAHAHTHRIVFFIEHFRLFTFELLNRHRSELRFRNGKNENPSMCTSVPVSRSVFSECMWFNVDARQEKKKKSNKIQFQSKIKKCSRK